VVRYAFNLAAQRSRQHLTLVHKTNVLTYAGDLWQRVVAGVSQDFPSVTTDYQHVDAATMFLVTKPERFDVIVTDNLFGDILTDLGAAVAGGIGLAASGNINPERTAPSMFEPVHGSAPDIAGQQKADPTAAILSAAMLCEHLGFTAEAARIEQAVADDLVERQGAWAARSTAEVGDDIAERVAG
jgi:3-isopropylmalate dehydrogenase